MTRLISARSLTRDPQTGQLVLLLAGFYILVFGLTLIAAAFRLRRAHVRSRVTA